MQKAVIELIDDIDGTEATETVTFSLDGVDYQIDLSEENTRRLRDALAEFMANARRVAKPGKPDARRPTGRAAPQMSEAARREQNNAIRAWARDRGFQVPERGRIAAKIIAAFHDAHRAA